jgi:TonB-linked SusC/RagA family outer membrane protein
MENMKKLFLLFCFVLASVGSISAQTRNISGKVSDTGGEPLIGVSVSIQGTSLGTVTDLDGTYTLSAQTGNQLEFSYLGMQSQVITVAASDVINVVLTDDAVLLEEAVVVGYGSQKVKDLTSSIVTIKADEIMKTPTGSAMNALQGKVAGLHIVGSGAPGDAPTVRLRGIGSYPKAGTDGKLSTNDAPLYVVDGIFYDNIDFLNTADIATLSVLKDASAAAIYGVKAANGVILIETKGGGFDKKTEVVFNGYYGAQRAQNILKMANSEQFTTMAMESGEARDAAFIDAAMQRYGRSRENPNVPVPNTDWYNEILRVAPIQDYGVGISGGTSNVSYAIGTNYFSQQGIMDMKNDYDRFNLRSKIDFKATDWLTVGGNVIWSQATKHPEEFVAWNQAYFAVPILPVVDDSDPTADFRYANAKDLGFRSGQNPLPVLRNSDKKHLIKKLMASFYAQIDLIPKKLSVKTSYNDAYQSLDERDVLLPYDYGDGLRRLADAASLTKTMKTYNDVAWDNVLTYNDTFSEDHNLTAMLGSSYRNYAHQLLKVTGLNFPYDTSESWYIDQAADRLTAKDKLEGKGDQQYTMSYFGRLAYNYKHRYLLYGTLRADGSSKYQEKWGYFPSVGAGWVVSEEKFMENLQAIDYLKLRASWGQLGNESIPASNGSMSTDIIFLAINDIRNSGTTTVDAFSYLKWELTEETNVGLSAMLFQNRLGIEADYYTRDTKNAAIEVTIPFVDKKVTRNVGVIRNSGFELALNWNDKITNDWTYNIGVNLATLKNEVRDLYGQEYVDGGTEEFRQRSYVGQPLLSFYGYKITGVYQNQAEIEADPIAVANGLVPGDLKFQNTNNDDKLDGDDRVLLGSYFPTFMYGANLGLGYKNIELSASLTGQSGNKILNRKRGEYIWTNDTNIDADVAVNRWHGEGTSNRYPSASGLRRGWNQKMSDYFVEDGAFFRIQNITLAYNILNKKLGGIVLPQMRISLTAEKPLTVFKYNGFNPEIPNGIDSQTYPVPAVYTIGLNVKF